MTKLPIRRVQVRRLRIPLPEQVSFSVKTLTHREHLIITVETDSEVGTGFCLQDLTAHAAQDAAVHELLPRLVGEDALGIRSIWNDLYAVTGRSGRRGSLMHAMSAIDVALWDHLARTAGLALHTVLGAYRTEVPCYASGGYYYDEGNGLDRLRDEVQTYVDAGYDAVKIKVGRLSAAEEIERVAAVRDVIGPNRSLMVDANGAYTSVAECARFCRKIEPLDITWIEEPFQPDNIEAFARLRKRTSIPLATGELEATKWAFNELISRDAVDFVQADATACGGITEWLQIAALAEAAGVGMAPHYHWDLHVQLACACPGVTYLEKFEGTGVKNFDLVLDRPMQTNGRGALTVPEGPGHGINFDDEAVDRFTVDLVEIT